MIRIAGAVAVILTVTLVGVALYLRSLPPQTLDLRALLDRRRPVEGEPLDPAWVARVRSLPEADGPIAPELARELGDALLDADAPESTGWMTDVDGDGSRDIVLKRYWLGTGVGFDLLIILNCRTKPTCYRFNGGERGGTYYALEDLIPVQQHVLDLRNDGSKVVVVPEVLIDRGADTVLNWPSLYAFHQGCFVVVDRQYRSFYEQRVLPKLPTGKADPPAGDVRAIREQVGRLYP